MAIEVKIICDLSVYFEFSKVSVTFEKNIGGGRVVVHWHHEKRSYHNEQLDYKFIIKVLLDDLKDSVLKQAIRVVVAFKIA